MKRLEKRLEVAADAAFVLVGLGMGIAGLAMLFMLLYVRWV
jgi:hypothetical protein